MSNDIQILYESVIQAAARSPAESRTAKLLSEGMAKMAKKLAEEAVEVSLEAVAGNRESMVRESADLLYNLVVIWAAAGIRPDEVWGEMDRRVRLLGIAEKLPKPASTSN